MRFVAPVVQRVMARQFADYQRTLRRNVERIASAAPS
jgi:hypothetical protein